MTSRPRHPSPQPRPPRLAERPLREDLVTQACLEAYGSIRHEGRLADRALDFTLRHKRNLYSQERRAVAERVYALLRRQITIDHLLARVAPGFGQWTTSRQDLLRLAASRMLMGERAGPIAKGSGVSPGDAALLDKLPAAAAELTALPFEERFPIAASLPPFLAERFIAEFGDQAEAAAEAMGERAPLTVRANALKTAREELTQRLAEEQVASRPTPLSPHGLFLETRVNAFSLASFREGLFEVQDEGSQLLGMLVDAPPKTVVDACAGAGGKTLQLSAQMKNRGELFAFDVNERRLDELRKRARRAGVHNVRTRLIPEQGEPAREAIADLRGKADRVLVDAPCSGTGTFRRKPDARYRLTSEDLQRYVSLQSELLESFSGLVKPGGRLVYGTCSVLREENEGVVEEFLRRHSEYSVLPAVEVLGPGLARTTRDGFLRLAPHLHGTDGFFGAVLVRAR